MEALTHERFTDDERKLFARLEIVGRNTGNDHVRLFCEDMARLSKTSHPITQGQYLYAKSVILDHVHND